MLTACISIRLHRFKGLVPKKTAFTSNASPKWLRDPPGLLVTNSGIAPSPQVGPQTSGKHCHCDSSLSIQDAQSAGPGEEHSASLPLVVTSAHISVLTSREGPLTFSVQGFHWDSITLACLLSHWPHASLIASPLFPPLLQRSSV